MRFIRNIARAWKYNRKKHVPVEVFIAGVEDRWRRSMDPNSKVWLGINPMPVDLLHQMLTGQLVVGDKEIDYDISVVFLDRMMFSAADVQPESLHHKDAFVDILDQFSQTYPNAGALISRAFAAYLHGAQQESNCS